MSIKRGLSTLLRSRTTPVVVAGLGRCGTTMVFSAAMDAGLRPGGFLATLTGGDPLRRGTVYKTHDYPPEWMSWEAKTLFLFADPRNIALSTFRRINDWGALHHFHLRSDRFEPNDQVLREDSLGLAMLFDAWMRPQNFTFVSVRYESLHSAQVRKQLGEYLGFNLLLPCWRARRADWSCHQRREQLQSVYGDLAERVAAVDDIKLWPCSALTEGIPSDMQKFGSSKMA